MEALCQLDLWKRLVAHASAAAVAFLIFHHTLSFSSSHPKLPQLIRGQIC